MQLRISVEATAFREDNTSDGALLASIHGASSDELLSEYIVDYDDHRLNKLDVIHEGKIEFRYDRSTGRLWAVVTYRLDRRLNFSETGSLLAYTLGQLSDGIGENFVQDYAGGKKVVINPMVEPSQIRVEYE